MDYWLLIILAVPAGVLPFVFWQTEGIIPEIRRKVKFLVAVLGKGRAISLLVVGDVGGFTLAVCFGVFFFFELGVIFTLKNVLIWAYRRKLLTEVDRWGYNFLSGWEEPR